MEFTIALPERFKFGDWEVCLKSLILPSRGWNIYDETMPKWSFISNTDISKDMQGVYFDFAQGSYEVIDLIEMIQQKLDINSIPIRFSLDMYKNRVRIKLERKYLEESDVCTLLFNGYLTKLLGFSVKGENMRIDLTKKSRYFEAIYTPNLHAFTPKSIIVTCDIVDETVFGGQRLKLLRLITNKMDRSGDTLHYDFIHDEYIKLGTHEFDKIKIRISDVTGNLLKVDFPEIETRLQLEFREST